MFLRSISADNFRTLSTFSLTFDDHYTAICGKNNSGKTNVIKAIRSLLTDHSPYYWEDRADVMYKRDRIAWQPETTKDPIVITAVVEVDSSTDQGLLEFLSKFMPTTGTPSANSKSVSISAKASFGPEARKEKYEVSVNGHALDDFSSQEVIKKLRSSSGCVYHNSTNVMQYRYAPGSRFSLSATLPETRQKKLSEKQKALVNEIETCLDKHREAIAEMIGRLSDKYEVSLSLPSIDVDQLPFGILLGDKGYQVPLDEWGSGTRNRTMILRTLFEARQAAQANRVSDRLTPIVIIEEPECFLHPSAQAEFGSVLQDLASEFKIQLIVTSHSPYMLSHRKPDANVLLARKTKVSKRKGKVSTKVTETERVQTSGGRWMEPFEHALGVSGPEFEYLKSAIFSNAREIILVEGPTDAEYLNDLCKPEHGSHALDLNGSIVSYDGTGNLTNGALVKFVLNLFGVSIVTFDLDKDKELSPMLLRLERKRDLDFFAVGRDASGCRSIEGLLPSELISRVAADNPELIRSLSSDNKEEAKSARNQLKILYRKAFSAEAKPQSEAFSEFYKLTKKINKAIAEQRATRGTRSA